VLDVMRLHFPGHYRCNEVRNARTVAKDGSGASDKGRGGVCKRCMYSSRVKSVLLSRLSLRYHHRRLSSSVERT